MRLQALVFTLCPPLWIESMGTFAPQRFTKVYCIRRQGDDNLLLY